MSEGLIGDDRELTRNESAGGQPGDIDAGVDKNQIVPRGRVLNPAWGTRQGLPFSHAQLLNQLPAEFPPLLVPATGAQEIDQHAPEFRACPVTFGVGLEGAGQLVVVRTGQHAFHEVLEIPAGLRHYVLAGVQIGQPQEGGGTVGADPQDFAAQRDGVVEEALLAVGVGGLLVSGQRRVGVPILQFQVANAVVQRGVSRLVGPGQLLQGPVIDLNGLTPFFPQFVASRGVFQLVQIHGADRDPGK